MTDKMPLEALPAPNRRLRLMLDMQADSLHDLWSALTMLANDLDHDGRTEREVTSGGYSDGYHLTLTDRGEHVTHDFYVEELDAYLAARR